MAGIKRQLLAAEETLTHAVFLGDLLMEGIGVLCWCNRCGHHRQIAPERLVAEFGPAQAVPELGGRLRCPSCGAKDVATCPAWPERG